MPINTTAYTAAQIQDMKNWIMDCVWQDLDTDDVAQLTDTEVLRGVQKHYDGGLAEFMRSYPS